MLINYTHKFADLKLYCTQKVVRRTAGMTDLSFLGGHHMPLETAIHMLMTAWQGPVLPQRLVGPNSLLDLRNSIVFQAHCCRVTRVL